MKFNTLFVAAVCAGTLFNSCVHKTAQENQLKYTHTSLVDGDAFAIIHKVGEVALVGIEHAEGVEANGDAKGKEVASKIKGFYEQFIPALDSIATAFHVDFPIKGIPALHEEAHEAVPSTDSTAAVVATTAATHEHGDYAQHAQHDIATIKEQLTRLSHITNKELQNFAKTQLSLANDLYTQIGGKDEGHAHHH